MNETKLTEIPEDGWNESHDGLQVRLMMPLGTIIEDEIIGLPVEGGQMIYGPSQEIGMILARAAYAMQAQEAARAWTISTQKQMEDWE